MPKANRKLLLITGIPGTGKTTFGNFLDNKYGFVHFDIEQPIMHERLWRFPANTIDDILDSAGDVVVTWGFVPDQHQTGIVSQFRDKGFNLIWFDGDRPSALRVYIKRGRPEDLFYLQMWRIENSKVVQFLAPLIIKTIDENGEFKSPDVLLEEIENGKERS